MIAGAREGSLTAGTAGTLSTPRSAGYAQPAEWSPHEACWLAWPSHADLWGDELASVRQSVTALAFAIADLDDGGAARGERLEVLVLGGESEASARKALEGLPARFHTIPFGDVWLRDTAPVFVKGATGTAAVSFAFNGWGGKYELPGDAEVSARIAAASLRPVFRFPWVLEGGSVEVDGEGACLTTRQCLLNPNRNPSLSREAIEEGLCEALGATKVLWLGDGLRNDHTDGHVDTLARFVAPGRVVCMEPRTTDDPNREALAQIARDLSAMTDARGRRLDVVTVPSPGLVLDAEGRPMPASYVNFYIANAAVIVPVYDSRFDEEAVRLIGELFPSRNTLGVPARELLGGGGAFHCITQQQPS